MSSHGGIQRSGPPSAYAWAAAYRSSATASKGHSSCRRTPDAARRRTASAHHMPMPNSIQRPMNRLASTRIVMFIGPR